MPFILRIFNVLVFVGLNLFLSLNSFSHEKLTTNDMNDVLIKLKVLEKNANNNNLVVFDIDNTLLSTDGALASDQWFEWQSQLISRGGGQYAISKNMQELLETYCKLLPLVQTRPTQSNLSVIIDELKKSRASVILLTSRRPSLRSTTEENLKLHHLWLADKSFNKGFLDQLTVPGYNVPTTFMNGIFMTSGIHKGDALKFILKYSNKIFNNLIFVDDHERHIARVLDTFKNQNTTNIIAYRFGREDDNVKRFNEMNKEPIHQQYLNLIKILNEVFPKNRSTPFLRNY